MRIWLQKFLSRQKFVSEYFSTFNFKPFDRTYLWLDLDLVHLKIFQKLYISCHLKKKRIFFLQVRYRTKQLIYGFSLFLPPNNFSSRHPGFIFMLVSPRWGCRPAKLSRCHGNLK